MLSKDAAVIWQYLNGIICIYKSPNITMQHVYKHIKKNLAAGLNQLNVRPTKPYVAISGDTTKKLNVEVRSSYADNTLVVGSRYLPEDFQCRAVCTLGLRSSGVCGINKGVEVSGELWNYNLVRTYHITGQLGMLTDDGFSSGKVLYSCNYNYVDRTVIDTLVASMQAGHRQNVFNLLKINPGSQTAYELAASGLIRPIARDVPVVYSMKCISMELPYFTIEVHAVNENTEYLIDLIDRIGRRIKNAAVVHSIRCIRHGFFSVEDALLKKHWTLEYIINNMRECNERVLNSKEFSIHLEEKQKLTDEEKCQSRIKLLEHERKL